MSHSPEPWKTTSPTGVDNGVWEKCPLLRDGDGIPVAAVIDKSSAHRIVACVNAMKGIEAPEAFMAQIRRVMLHRGKSQIPVAACQSLREELAKLAELGEFEVYT